jgi:hypothetical protein
MTRKLVWLSIVLALCAGAVLAWLRQPKNLRGTSTHMPAPAQIPATVPTPGQLREVLFAELQPVRLANCEFERFGEKHDGGYLLCGNLLSSVQSAYSYGISGYDGWGCQVSKRLKVEVHEYDCFDLTEPACPGGRTIFHAECVGGAPATDKAGRIFDTPEHQILKNGDAGKHLVVKMDVEGAEWDTFLRTPDDLFERIDQLVVEFHGVDKERFPDAVRKLKRFFYIANLHFNNYTCIRRQEPFPAWAYEALFVSKRLGIPDASGAPILTNPLNARNDQYAEDCQTVDAAPVVPSH